MSDRAVVAVAAAALAGAWTKFDAPSVAIVLAVLVLLTSGRRAPLVVAAVFVCGGTLGARAWNGLTPALVAGSRIEGIATLVADPRSQPGGSRVDARIDGMRLRMTVGADAGSMVNAAAGERWQVVGRYSPFDDVRRARLASRHLAGRLVVTDARRLDGGSPVARVANGSRRLLLRGTTSFDHDQRALFTGVVLGDDREQDPAEVEDFRASGLTHLLAVSGQNVAFLLALAAPVLRRLRFTPRFATAVLLLAVFGTVTRWEPSVTRAVVMAGVTLLASTLGRPVAPLRVLALAVTGLVLVDPLLVHSIGFGLSVAACVGLAVLAPALRQWMPEPLAVTAAAQVAVMPLLLPLFGPVPLVSLPANLLAGPAAGPLMMWGVAAGSIAGVLGGTAATVIHLPTRLLLAWLSAVARWSAGLRMPWITPRAAIALAIAGGAAWAAARYVPARRWRRVGLGAAMGALVLTPVVGVTAARVPVEGVALASGGGDTLWRAGRVAVVTSQARSQPGRLLGALRVAGVRRVDVLVVTSSSRAAWRTIGPVRDRLPIALVLAPANHQLADAVAVERPVVVSAGPFTVDVRPDGKRLTVRVASARAPRARVPPVRHHDARARHGHPQPHPRLVLRQGGSLPVRRLPAPRRVAGRSWSRPARRRWRQGRSGP